MLPLYISTLKEIYSIDLDVSLQKHYNIDLGVSLPETYTCIYMYSLYVDLGVNLPKNI